MAIRDIIRMGHPTLRTPAQPYPLDDIGSAHFNQLVEDLTETLADSGGIGLAAPQINEPVQVVIVNIPGGPTRYGALDAVPLSVYINPTPSPVAIDVMSEIVAGAVQDGELPAYGSVAMAGAS